MLNRKWEGKDIKERDVEPGSYTITGWYAVAWIENTEESVIQNNIKESGMSHYTTSPKEIVIE
jgi:hypothetical protein